MAKFPMIPQQTQRDILKEFTEVAVEASTGILGGVGYTQSALEKSVGVFRATNIVGRVAPVRTPFAAMQQIIEMEPRQIHNLLKQEQPQTIALVMSYLGAAKSAQLLVLLPAGDSRTSGRTRGHARRHTHRSRREARRSAQPARRGETHPRPEPDRRHEDSPPNCSTRSTRTSARLFSSPSKSATPSWAQASAQKMFTFEDLSMLDVASLQKVLREIDMRDLAVSLKSASDKLKTTLLACISKRAAETVNEEMGFMGPLKLKDIEAAQGNASSKWSAVSKAKARSRSIPARADES